MDNLTKNTIANYQANLSLISTNFREESLLCLQMQIIYYFCIELKTKKDFKWI